MTPFATEHCRLPCGNLAALTATLADALISFKSVPPAQANNLGGLIFSIPRRSTRMAGGLTRRQKRIGAYRNTSKRQGVDNASTRSLPGNATVRQRQCSAERCPAGSRNRPSLSGRRIPLQVSA